jgi:hypothetical protein
VHTIFVDSINWLEYAQDAKGRTWLIDYPNSNLHGGGPQRSRELIGDPKVLTAFNALLGVLSVHSRELHEAPKQTSWHLASIGEIAIALGNGDRISEPLRTTKQAFGRSFLPNSWGESVESAWAKFAEVAGTFE